MENRTVINFENVIKLYEEAKRHGILEVRGSALRVCYTAATTTQEVFKTWELANEDDGAEAGFTWKKVCARALELAKTPEDAWEVFVSSTYDAPDTASFNKVLELCKSKEQILNVMDALGQVGGDLDFEECYKKLSQRASELPDCPKDRKIS